MKPYPMWGERPYYSLDFYLKQQFGHKLFKLALNGGMTCPNRDGTLGQNGCIFCSKGGSGEFASDFHFSITEQIEMAKKAILHKSNTISLSYPDSPCYIAYFQAYTNTYAPVSYLREIFYEAVSHPDIAVLSIATRPDCLDASILSLLAELNCKKRVWVELGLQTSSAQTAELIHRECPLIRFTQAIHDLKRVGISVILHVILGLPTETQKQILQTVSYINAVQADGVKFQLLHILKNTVLADWITCFPILEKQEYIRILLDCIAALSPEIVIHRITGDAPSQLLLEPAWSLKKKQLLNEIHHAMKAEMIYQGKNFV